jgi:hypothetical protein
MFSMNQIPHYDVGLIYVWIFWGVGYAIFASVLVVAIEARIMKEYFLNLDKRYRPYKERIKFSLIINGISTAIGIPINYFLFRKFGLDHIFLFVLLNFIFTLVIEFISAKIFIKPTLKSNRLVEFEIKSNLASYALIFGIPIIFSFFVMWFSV